MTLRFRPRAIGHKMQSRYFVEDRSPLPGVVDTLLRGRAGHREGKGKGVCSAVELTVNSPPWALAM